MKQIRMLDLEAQHAPLQPELEAAAVRVLRSNRFIMGSEVERFEREAADALGTAHAVGMSSGTDALTVILSASGVGPGDEVVTTPFSFFATVEAILRLGAVPVFADIEPATCNIDPGEATALIGPRTKAVLIVHLYGRVARTAQLAAACAARGVALLEDAAQAIGARASDLPGAPRVGTLGAAAALSFHPAKNLGGFGDGGMVLTMDPALAAKARQLRVHGADERFRHVTVGGNFRLDELQAALLRVKLAHLEAWTEKRRRLAGLYREGLAGVPLGLPPPDGGSVWNQVVVRVPDGRRDALAEHLRRHGIASAIYYPQPLHLQPALGALAGKPGALPRVEQAAREVLALPVHPCLTEDDVAYVCRAARSYFDGGG